MSSNLTVSIPRAMALAHTLENKTEEAHWRGDLFEKRIKAMRAWAEFLQPANLADVTPLRANRPAKPSRTGRPTQSSRF